MEENLFVRESNHLESDLFQIHCSICVPFHLFAREMICAIHLNNKPLLQTNEIGNVIVYHMLPFKLDT